MADRLRQHGEAEIDEAALSRAVDFGVRGQHLLGQRGAGARHADDKERPIAVGAEPGHSLEVVGGESREQSIYMAMMSLGGVALVAILPVLLLKGVGNNHVLGSARVITPAVVRLGKTRVKEGSAGVGHPRRVQQGFAPRDDLLFGISAEGGGEAGEGGNATRIVVESLAKGGRRTGQVPCGGERIAQGGVQAGCLGIELDRLAVTGHRPVHVSLLQASTRQASVCSHPARVSGKHVSVGLGGSLRFADFQEDGAQMAPGLRHVGIQGQGTLEPGGGLSVVPQFEPGLANGDAQRCGTAVQTQRLCQGIQGLIDLPALQEQAPEVVLSHESVWIEGHGSAAMLQAPLEFAALGEQEAKVGVGFHQVWIKVERLAVSGQGLVDAALTAQHVCQGGNRAGGIRLEAQSISVSRLGLRQPRLPGQRHAQIVQRLEGNSGAAPVRLGSGSLPRQDGRGRAGLPLNCSDKPGQRGCVRGLG